MTQSTGRSPTIGLSAARVMTQHLEEIGKIGSMEKMEMIISTEAQIKMRCMEGMEMTRY